VRPGRDLDFPPGKEDVWVVPLLLCKLAYEVYELEGFAKVGKLEGLRDVVLSITFHPSTCFCREASSSSLRGGTPTRHETHVLVARSDITATILALGGERPAIRTRVADTGFVWV
jgi:hypothetical protein